MIRLLEWLLMLVSDVDIWDRNTGPRRGDDSVMAGYRRVNRQAGFAIQATFSALLLAAGWAAFGPSAGIPPYRGVSFLIHWADLAVHGLLPLCLIVTAIRCYQAWTYFHRRLDDR